MNILKSVLAASFIGFAVYVIAVLSVVLKGIGPGKATGFNGLMMVASNPINFLFGIVGAGLSFWFFVKH